MEILKPLGFYVHIIERRPDVVHSILLPVPAIPLLIRTLAIALQLQR